MKDCYTLDYSINRSTIVVHVWDNLNTAVIPFIDYTFTYPIEKAIDKDGAFKLVLADLERLENPSQ